MTDKHVQDAMQRLRKLLFKKEEERIAAIEEVRNNKELHAQEIAKVLVEALALRAHDDGLGKALTPAVEKAVSESIAQNPQTFADALFPVMGPAIRRSIQQAIADMLQSLNQTLEHAFSARSLQWRWQAFRTGKPFAEVVMLNTLLYRVEQVFWIHKGTGLLLAHHSFDPSLSEDADVVSSMLTAVGDFIQDSFQGNQDQEVESLRLGDLEVLIEQAPDSVLAIVCRGNPPHTLRVLLSETLEQLQQTFHQNLKTFEGDTSTFAAAHDLLMPLLQVDYVEQEKKSPMKLIWGLACAAAVVTLWASWDIYQYAQRTKHWDAYIQALKDTPGLVITDVDERDGIHHIYGLRDHLAIQAQSLLPKFHLQETDVRYHFQAYHALNSDIMLKRLWHLSKAPSSVSMNIRDHVLYIHGRASQAWLAQLPSMTQWMDGIDAVNIDDVTVLAAPKTFQKRVMQSIRLSPGLSVHVHGHDVRLTGQATQSALNTAKASIAHVKGLATYDDNAVIRLDSPDYVLQQARKKLQPPKGVQLSVTQEHILKASGYAPEAWIKQFKQQGKHLAYVADVDVRKLKPLKQLILARAIAALKPPASVELALHHGVLSATGEADGTWISLANKQAIHVKGVTSFQNNVKQIWHDDEVLKEAVLRLHPSSSVQLSFSKGILQARGSASKGWIAFAHREALHIDGVFTFDEHVDVRFSDEEILKSAMQQLQPPNDVRFEVTEGQLKVFGEADAAWIKSLQLKRADIEGLKSLDVTALKTKPSQDTWSQLQQQVSSIHLQTPASQPILSANDKQQIKHLSALFHQALALHSKSKLHISITYKHAKKLVLKMRYRAIESQLKQHHVNTHQITVNFHETTNEKQDSTITFQLIGQP